MGEQPGTLSRTLREPYESPGTYRDHGPHTIHLDVPASARYLGVIGACIGELLARVDGLDDAEALTYNVQLAVQEICVNVVKHAYGGEDEGDGGHDNRIAIALTLAAPPLRLIVECHDGGQSFDPARIPIPDLEHAQVNGYGLFLVHHLIDTVTYDPCPGHNRWRLVKYLQGPNPHPMINS